MRRLLLSSIAALAAALVPSAAATPARPSAVPDCLGKPLVRPARLVFACADANFGARGLHWTGWGSSFAAAVGVGYANDCTPTCVAGGLRDYRVVVVASGSERCPGGRRAYARLEIAFVGPSPFPRSTIRDLTYPLHCGAR